MKQRCSRAWTGVGFAVATLWLTSGAQAFDAQQFSPAVDPQGYFSVYSSRTAPAGRFHVALWYDYAGDPVTASGLSVAAGLGPDDELVSEIHTLDLVASYSLLDWLEIGFDVPFSDIDSDLPGARQNTGPDNIRVLGKFQLLDSREKPIGLAVVPFVDVPSGDERRLTSDGELGFGGIAVADFVYQRMRASLNGGYKSNGEGDFRLPSLNDGSDEILFGLGLGVLAIKDTPILFGYVNNAEVLAEAFGATEADHAFNDEFGTPVEMLGGVRLFGTSGLYLTAGIGKSITQSINGSAVRVVASIGYTPPPPPPPPPPAPPPPPPQPQVVVTDEQIVTLAPVLFDFDKATLKPESPKILDQVAEVMRSRPTAVVRVEGHTDSFGSDTYNQKLSERRTQTCVRYLISKGVEASRLEAVGYGETRPIATNDTAQGRAKNRRTEFHIVKETR